MHFYTLILLCSLSLVQSTFLELFDGQTKSQVEQVYKAAPGSLAVYLMEKKVVKPIYFRSMFEAKGVGVGTDEDTVIHKFNKELRESIEKVFTQQQVTEIRPEDISMDITKRYEDKLTKRPKPGKNVPTTIIFDQIYKGKEGGPLMTLAQAHVYIEIIEMCENNWFKANERTFDYHLKIEITGLSIERDKMDRLREVISLEGVPATIAFVQKFAALTFDDL